MTMLTKCMLASILVFQACWAIPPVLVPRVTDGIPATLGEFPYQVSIELGSLSTGDYVHDCGGSILNENYILTAAHCALRNGKLRVVAGKYYYNQFEESNQVINVNKTVVHSGYNGGMSQHDIALLKLERPLTLNRQVAPIKLPAQGLKQTGRAVVIGWGSISKRILYTSPTVLQKGLVRIIDNRDCYEQLTSQADDGIQPELFDTQLCSSAVGDAQASACNGDSGGPLVQPDRGEDVQVGIVSWGPSPCGPWPTVYTRVASYVDWIHEHIN